MVREAPGGHEVAVIRPHNRPTTALPKGHIDPGENAEGAALREVREETGLEGALIARLGDVRYVYKFQGQTIFKQVSFFLFRQVGGTIDALSEPMRVEVERAYWVPLADAPRLLSFKGEREMASKAIAFLSRPRAD